MKIIADLHMHSRFSEAVSPHMTPLNILRMAEKKGVTLLGTGDFTHPEHLEELKELLRSSGEGIYRLKNEESPVSFLLTAEVTNIFYSKFRKEKRTHVLILAPSMEVVDKLNAQLTRWGRLDLDGRPTFRRHVKDLTKLVLDTSSECMIIPAHAWTPWYSVFGSAFGFNSLEECFEEETANIHAIETGLDSDPSMNWRIADLDRTALISSSDAHSLTRIGREATVFDCGLDYAEITTAVRRRDRKKLVETLELFPEYGKYYLDGHRKCGISFSLEETRRKNYICPRCRTNLTVGVHHRVEALAARAEGFTAAGRIPFRKSLPLEELIAASLGVSPQAKTVQDEWEKMIGAAGTEIEILYELPENRLRSLLRAEVADLIVRMRSGTVDIEPGYDGVYGKIRAQIENPKIQPSQFELF